MLIITAIIAVLAVVQSLFGIGLLVFGTPTLLLLGHSFSETLSILLPASIAVSLLQSWGGKRPEFSFICQFGTWCLAPMVVTLVLVLLADLRASLDLAVALSLVGFMILRVFPFMGENVRHWIADYPRIWFSLTGVIHGISNLGGGPLAIFAASRYSRKEDIRSLIAFCYASFAAIQLSVLAFIDPGLFHGTQLLYAALAGGVFILVEQQIFRKISMPAYDHLFTTFVGLYAGLLMVRFMGWL